MGDEGTGAGLREQSRFFSSPGEFVRNLGLGLGGAGLDKVPGGHPFHFFKYFAEIKCAFKTETVCHLINFHPLFQEQGFGQGDFLLGDIFRKTDAAVLLKGRLSNLGLSRILPPHHSRSGGLPGGCRCISGHWKPHDPCRFYACFFNTWHRPSRRVHSHWAICTTFFCL